MSDDEDTIDIHVPKTVKLHAFVDGGDDGTCKRCSMPRFHPLHPEDFMLSRGKVA